MAQNYASATLKKIDERFALDCKTDMIVNNGITLDFSGINTVTIYNINTVAETDYVRSGTQRFGSLVELGTGTQTFVLSQDKAFTFSVDRGNLEDSMMIQEVNKSVQRQVREISIPTTDIYRLGVLDAYARANSQGATGPLTKATVFEAILAERAALIQALVPVDDLVVYMSPTIESVLWVDPEFKLQCNLAYADNKQGVIGNVLGMTMVVLPTTYFPANFNFMVVAKNVLVAPYKFNSIRVLTDVQGIDGAVAEGRRYYDAFIPTNKGVAIRAQHSA